MSQERCDLICMDAPRAEAIRAKLIGEGVDHLGALRSRGLGRSRKDGKMVMYSLTEAGVSLLSAALGDTAEVSA